MRANPCGDSDRLRHIGRLPGPPEEQPRVAPAEVPIVPERVPAPPDEIAPTPREVPFAPPAEVPEPEERNP